VNIADCYQTGPDQPPSSLLASELFDILSEHSEPTSPTPSPPSSPASSRAPSPPLLRGIRRVHDVGLGITFTATLQQVSRVAGSPQSVYTQFEHIGPTPHGQPPVGVPDLDLDLDEQSDVHPASAPASTPPLPASSDDHPTPREPGVPASRPPALEVYQASGEVWYIRDVQLLVATLHTRFQVSFRACGLILSSLRIIFVGLGLKAAASLPLSLTTVLSHFQLEDRFALLPSCPVCHALFAVDSPPTSECPDCTVPLFKKSRGLLCRVLGRPTLPPKPVRGVPVARLETLLADAFAEGTMEDDVDVWRKKPSRPGEYSRIQDGRIWSEIKDHKGKPFFAPESLEEPDELRVGVVGSLDWYV
jgi:hypothetical protein